MRKRRGKSGGKARRKGEEGNVLDGYDYAEQRENESETHKEEDAGVEDERARESTFVQFLGTRAS